VTSESGRRLWDEMVPVPTRGISDLVLGEGSASTRRDLGGAAHECVSGAAYTSSLSVLQQFNEVHTEYTEMRGIDGRNPINGRTFLRRPIVKGDVHLVVVSAV